MNKTILYDGQCGLCSRSVRFVQKRDPKQQFDYVALQSEQGTALLQQHALPDDLSTLVYIEEGRAFVRSTGALRICRLLRPPWPLCYPMFIWVPRPLRDGLYRLIARFRHLFGRPDACGLE